MAPSTNRAEECIHPNRKWDLELKIMTRATDIMRRPRPHAVMRAHSNRPRARIARTRFFDVGGGSAADPTPKLGELEGGNVVSLPPSLLLNPEVDHRRRGKVERS